MSNRKAVKSFKKKQKAALLLGCVLAAACIPEGTGAETQAVKATETQAVNPAESRGARVLADTWVLAPDLTLGLRTKLGKAYLRKDKDFEVEIFYANGVVTSLRERIPGNVLKLLDTVKKAPEGFPKEFAPPEDLYKTLKQRLHPGDEPMATDKIMGGVYAGKYAFDLLCMRPVGEFYWTARKGKDGKAEWFYGGVFNQDYAIERMLIREIPQEWH